MWDPKKYTKEINEGVEFILNSYGKYEEPEKHFNKYGWYYHTQACFQKGGSAWRDWNRFFQDGVVEHQNQTVHGPTGVMEDMDQTRNLLRVRYTVLLFVF